MKIGVDWRATATAFCLFLASFSAVAAAFETIGVPVRKAGLMGVLVGPGPEAGTERIYFNFRQDGGKLFLVAVDPETDESQQFASPVGTGAWGFIVGPDNKIYLGTHEGPDPEDSGRILVFNPNNPEREIQVVGRPSETETYIWQFCIGPNNKLYGCTYGNAKMISYDPATGEMADLGRMDPEQQYTRSICTGPDGKIYTAVGIGDPNVAVYDPATGEHERILPEKYRWHSSQTSCSVWKGVDGNVYVSVATAEEVDGEVKKGSATLKVQDGELVVAENPASAVDKATFEDGRRVKNATLNGTYDIVHPDGTVEHKEFTYAGDGAGLFVVDNGPLGRIYGGTYMPNEIFWYDPATGEIANPGNPSEVGGEIYSMLDHDGVLYTCSYPGSFLSKWDPSKPWNYGREDTNNPQGFGRLGPGHLRPRAMIHGPEKKIYIGSYPEYGLHGGSLGVWNPKTDELIENYHHLIKNQAIVSLVHDEKTGFVFGGSSTQGGGGTTPIEPEAKFFTFDPESKKLVRESVPVEGAQAIRALCQVDRKIYGIAKGDTLFVYDIDAGEVVHRGELGVGSVLDDSFRLWNDGMIYGVASTQVFKVDPETYKAETLADYPERIRCGMAMDEHGIYFGVRAELVRFNWGE